MKFTVIHGYREHISATEQRSKLIVTKITDSKTDASLTRSKYWLPHGHPCCLTNKTKQLTLPNVTMALLTILLISSLPFATNEVTLIGQQTGQLIYFIYKVVDLIGCCLQ